jgi:hypothetical protein
VESAEGWQDTQDTVLAGSRTHPRTRPGHAQDTQSIRRNHRTRPGHAQDTPRTRVLALAYCQDTPMTRVLPTLWESACVVKPAVKEDPVYIKEQTT